MRGDWASARNPWRGYIPARDGDYGHAIRAPKGSLLIGAGVGQARSACSISLSMKHVVWHTQPLWLVCRTALTRPHGMAVDVQSTGATTDNTVQDCIVTSPAGILTAGYRQRDIRQRDTGAEPSTVRPGQRQIDYGIVSLAKEHIRALNLPSGICHGSRIFTYGMLTSFEAARNS